MCILPFPSPIPVAHLKPFARAGFQVVHVHALVHEAISALHFEKCTQASGLVLGRGASQDLHKGGRKAGVEAQMHAKIHCMLINQWTNKPPACMQRAALRHSGKGPMASRATWAAPPQASAAHLAEDAQGPGHALGGVGRAHALRGAEQVKQAVLEACTMQARRQVHTSTWCKLTPDYLQTARTAGVLRTPVTLVQNQGRKKPTLNSLPWK